MTVGECFGCGELTERPDDGRLPVCEECRDGNDGEEPYSDEPDPDAARAIFAERLREAGLDTRRFIGVLDGEKGSRDHTQHEPDSSALSGNYGVYGGSGDGDGGSGELIDVDIDDYRDDADRDGLDAVNAQPDTFAVESPHTDGEDGGHHYFQVVAGETFDSAPAAAEAATGATNPDLSWGEVRVENQYVVGPGSQLVGCDKDHCDECREPDGGYYTIAHDRPIATITADAFYEMLDADPETSGGRPGTSGGDSSGRDVDFDDITTPDVPGDAPVTKPRCYRASLEARVDVPGEAPNAHTINRIAAILAIYSGYNVKTGIEHFREYPPHDDPDTFDSRATRTALVGTADKIDSDDLHPPGIGRLRELGILDSNESCDCLLHRGSDRSVEAKGGAGLVETCSPPDTEVQSFNREDRWDAFAGDRYEAVVDDDGPVVWADEAGSGKTTNAARAAASRGRPHTVLFDKHEKAREFRTDDATPGGYFHLRGGEQKRHDVCMDADHADDSCPEHGDTRNCPSACPVYDLPKDADIRRRFDRLKAELGPVGAHVILGDDLPNHDEEGGCWWLEEFTEAASAERIVGVHEYQTLTTVQAYNDGRRDIIIDESPGTGAQRRSLDVEDVLRFQSHLEQLASSMANADVLGPLAEFTGDVLDVVADRRAEDSLAELEPPDIPTESYDVEVDPDDPPAWCHHEDVRLGTTREPRGMPERGAYVAREAYVAERSNLDERLAQAKLASNEATVHKMRDSEWSGEPLAMDVLFAAAEAAGLDETAVRRAIAAPTILDGTCPRCGGQLATQNGARVCSQEGRSCGWDERTDQLVGPYDAPARADVRRVANTLDYQELPAVDALPNSPLVLDATATPEKIAGLYGIAIDEVRVDGDDPVEANLHVTQVVDGQYHAGTLDDSDHLQERAQATIDKVGRLHDQPLIVGKQAILRGFDIPANAETLYYHAARGLNREACDAVVCIGAPHPGMDDLEREAVLLSQNRRDLRVGGEEHSTRRDCPNPPVYRKLRFTDAEGDGRALPTKCFTGLTGALFRECREKELEQVVHRIRPLLAEQTKHAYLLTNVPTDLPVDEVCQFDELADPLAALFPVSEGALDLAMVVRDVGAGVAPDGFRAEALVETENGEARFRVAELHRLAQVHGLDVSERTVRRWVHDLADLGLLDAGDYESREGVPYAADISTLTPALSVLTRNESVEVAIRRRLAALAAESNSAIAWLEAAREQFGLSGDRCRLDGGPDPGRPPG